jgi:hypothetical protein
MISISCHRLAELLGGHVRGADEVSCPGPGHSADDRSLSVKLDKDAPDGLLVHSFAGDDPLACRDYVRDKLGLAPFEPKKRKKKNGGPEQWTTLSEHIYRDEQGGPYLKVRKCRDHNGEKQFSQYHWDGQQWQKGKPKTEEGKPKAKVPYNLPQLIAAPLTTIVYFVEGEGCADSLAAIGLVATTASEGASAKWAPELTPHFKDRRVVVLADADKPGRAHAQKVARSLSKVAASLKVVDPYPERGDGHDVADWLKTDTAGVKLLKLVNEAPPWEPAAEAGAVGDVGDVDTEIERLAKLSVVDYEQQRRAAAEKLGVRALILDRLVEAERVKLGKDAKPDVLFEHWNVEAANEPIDGSVLLRAIKEIIRRYVFMSDDQAVAVTLWVLFSWLHKHMTHSPILYVTSAEKDSGKTTLLGVLNFLTRRSLLSVDISGAALFRSITKWQPTFIVDEADDTLANNPDLRSVINGGWTRGQGTIRCHWETHEPERFNAFAPKVVAMKGRKLPETTRSRSIIITMKPRRADDPTEHTADFDHLDNETFARLRAQAMRWATDYAEAIAKATPEIPPGFHNRRRANWKPLLAIAEAGGGEWKTAAWKAALAIEAIADSFDASIGVQLLQAIQVAFEARAREPRNKDRITSPALNDELIADKTAPWATYNKGKEISQAQVAKLLKPYGIKPKTIRWDDGTPDGSFPKGYLLEWFDDVFDRFCTSSSPGHADSTFHTSTELFSKENRVSTSVPGKPHVETRKSNENNGVDMWKPDSRVPGEKTHVQIARSKSDDLPYCGPVVAVPDLAPDPLDDHDAPQAAHTQPSTGGEPGLSQWRLQALADWYGDESHRRYNEGTLDTAALDAELRAILRKEVAFPEQIEVEFERVMQAVFAV